MYISHQKNNKYIQRSVPKIRQRVGKKNFNIMKKFLLVFSTVVCAMLFTSCNSEIDHPIAGNVYLNYGKTMSVFIYFYSNGNFEIDFMEKNILGETTHNKYEHMKWEIEGNKISVYYDKSSYWKPEVRGDLKYTGTYNSADNIVTLDGQKYEFSHKWN
jgi:hypothetical protein